ncbi:MAG: hypothetical protein NZ902_03935 [Acidilobaceae archaeon]|nr:hypothetical protein [Acidilobaceae archaeon]MCX8165120.1 hypothetical protein [Acidilobaceae archaeon]MDW7974364.1 hypothetical protein [Sulfolobales archaeon]
MREEVVEVKGMRILARRTEEGLLACSLCGSLFYSQEDLARHLLAHARGYERKLVGPRGEEEEEEELE